MIYLLYNILLTLSFIFTAPYFLFRALISERFRDELIQRMGFFQNLNLKKTIWVHAASVGEVFCTLPLIKRMKTEFPHSNFVMTTMTRMGNQTAKTQIPETEMVLFFPIDHPFFLERTLYRIQPNLLLIAETELWPNLLRSSNKRGIPIILFNGRISQKSFRRYLFLRFLFRECLKNISLFLMQTEEDRNRIIQIGAPSEKTRVVGNIKFDQPLPSNFQDPVLELKQSIGLQRGESILIAGSTHSGEEEILLKLFKNLRGRDPHLILILAPRHLDRLEEVERILVKEDVTWKRRTSFYPDQDRSERGKGPTPEVILLDTMGELMSFYRLATLVFIGGSLVPIGGHNPLEPLFFKKCVLFGPHMFNFLEISHGLIEARGAIQVEGEEDLFSHLKFFLSDERARQEVGEKGFQFLQTHRGATERMFKEIKPFLVL